MSLIYCVVARGTTVLAEYSPGSYSGNFIPITQVLLSKIPSETAKRTYVYDGKDSDGNPGERFHFHYMVAEAVTYLCMSSDQFSRMLAFRFLGTVQHLFLEKYKERVGTLTAYAANADFKHVLRDQMEAAAKDDGNKIGQVQQKLDEIKTIMEENISKVLEREELIVSLAEKSDKLNDSAETFRKRSKKLKKAMWWKNVKLMILIAFISLVLLYIVLAAACGGLDLRGCT